MNIRKKFFLKKPFYPGGTKALSKFIKENLVYPEDAISHNIIGTVQLLVEINDDGNVMNVKVIKHLGYGCDEEAIRVAKLLKYADAKQKGVHVKITTKLSIYFKPPLAPVNINYNYKQTETQQEKNMYNYQINIKS